MGNKIGFQVTKEEIKVVLALNDPGVIEFVRNELKNYVMSSFEFSGDTIVLFQGPLDLFLSQNYQSIATKLKSFLNKKSIDSKISIQTNWETIKIYQRNTLLKHALSQVFNSKIDLQHRQGILRTIRVLNIFNPMHQFYTFSNNFKLTQINRFETLTSPKKMFQKALPSEYLLIFMKNGVSYYSCNKLHAEKIDGSILGEQTLFNILKLKIPHRKPKELFSKAQLGNIKNTDIVVEDIYGKGVQNLGLPKDLVASSMGKLGKMSGEELSKLSDEDITRSLLTTFAINTGIQISVNLRKYKLQHALFLSNDLHSCDRFYQMIEAVCDTFAPGKTIVFSSNAPFMSCIGTALAHDI